MSLTGIDKIFSVEDQEYAYSAVYRYPASTGSTFELYVPKIMGTLSATGRATINGNGLFANASDCMPSYSKSINFGKYFHAKVRHYCSWSDHIDIKGKVPKGTEFTVEFLNGNISSPYMTTK